MENNSLVSFSQLTKGIYKHRYAPSATQALSDPKPPKIDFTFEEIKPITPLVYAPKPRVRWPSAYKAKIKLYNFDSKGQYIHDTISQLTPPRTIPVQNRSLQGRLEDFIRDMKETKRSGERWVGTPQKIIIHNQRPQSSETMKGFYTIKYIGELNDQLGVLSKKQSLFQGRQTPNSKKTDSPTVVIETPYLVNRYLIPRKLGQPGLK